MAQAARLNLRMQKELKLLITDPPPGSSFPSLTDEAPAASLTSIEAHFQGPEGTVYANGVFKIKIQIPERYPFQPPIVTFATPIYHPNIDNGGRICLDILNLPPKGSWQPSLNISTVLTSIGLLLSEPNPDDGLMHDASREYKYNRQAFDQKARSMTEKYARVGESTSSISICEGQTHTRPVTSKTKAERSEASMCATGDFNRFSTSSSRKLSLESLESSSNCNSNKGAYEFPHHDDSKNHIETDQIEEAKTTGSKVIQYPDKPHPARYKLSLNVPSLLEAQNPSVDSRENIQNKSAMQTLESTKTSCERKYSVDELKHVPKIAISKQVSLSTSQNTRSHYSEDRKENVAPIQQLLPKIYSQSNEITRKKKLCLIGGKLPLKPLEDSDRNIKLGLNSENNSNCQFKILSVRNDESANHVCDGESTKKKSGSSPIPEATIVLDSEDSEDEIVKVRSKLSLARNRLLRKRKSGV